MNDYSLLAESSAEMIFTHNKRASNEEGKEKPHDCYSFLLFLNI